MNTLRDLLQLIPQDDRHPAAIARDRLLIWGSLAGLIWGYAYAVFCICY